MTYITYYLCNTVVDRIEESVTVIHNNQAFSLVINSSINDTRDRKEGEKEQVVKIPRNNNFPNTLSNEFVHSLTYLDLFTIVGN